MNITCDVLVVGSGASGIAAAYSSAIAGARTVLIEKNNDIGGIAVSGIVNCIAGIFINKNNAFLNRGFVAYFAKVLSKNKLVKHTFTNYRYSVLLYNPSIFMQSSKHLIENLKNIKLIYNSNIVKVTKKDSTLSMMEITSNNKHIFISPKYVIDCTGDGELSYVSGAECLKNKIKLQSSGFGFTVKGVNTQDFFKSEYLSVIRNLTKSHSLKSIAENITFLRSLKTNELYIKFSTDSENLAKATNTVYNIYESLHKNFHSFKNSSISIICSQIYNREGRRILGEYVLDETDIINCKKHQDAAAKNNWPMELWYDNKAPLFKYLPENDYYTIPLRSLLVKGFSNLMVAGRCISVSQRALGSTRVIGTCLSLGEFCGLTAALSSKKNTGLRNIDINEVEYIRNKYEPL